VFVAGAVVEGPGVVGRSRQPSPQSAQKRAHLVTAHTQTITHSSFLPNACILTSSFLNTPHTFNPCRDPTTRQLYKDHLTFMLDRTNAITGQQYKSDPTIYGFDVLNEPRRVRGACFGAGGSLRVLGLTCWSIDVVWSPVGGRTLIPPPPTHTHTSQIKSTRRCPGCNDSALAAHASWLEEMTGHLRGLVSSSALVLAGTEGYFTPEASGAF
jgi:hypothetical protein